MNYLYSNKSLHNEICNELILLVNSEETDIEYSNSMFTKLYNYIYYEINIQIISYIKFLNEQNKYKYFQNNQFYIPKFTIYKINNKNINSLNNDIQVDTNLHTYSILRFIWVLDDINNEFIFLNDIKIKTFIGQIIIFPCYWSCPFKDTNLQDTKHFIIGYIEIENEDSKSII
jgi:hypothetical protein